MAVPDSCPALEGIVRTAVEAALQRDIALAAGLLRIFFHDCFPQGCDASVLLTGAGSEQQLGPNLTLQLVDDIRAQVHAACGRTVSCADIAALATRDAVAASGGLSYAVPLGRLDSLAPAPSAAVLQLPSPTSGAAALVDAFRSRGLDAVDLVALSGAHTVGRARCGAFSDRFGEDGDFVRRLAANCSSDAGRLQELNVATPDVFDNRYYEDLEKGQGVLSSDQALAGDWRTGWVVNGFAGNRWWFLGQFAQSMAKLGNLTGPGGNAGEIRRSCFVPSGQSVVLAAGASSAGDEGFLASA
ncbi:hypothetical protein ACP4OV_025970 [Aristida adscensionis]